MSVAAIFEESDEKTEMAVENSGNEEKKVNLGLCMSAGIKTPDNSEQNRFQRRHFPNKTSSNIFFCDYLPDDNASSRSSESRNDLFLPAGTTTRHADQKQFERRHFDLAPEDCMQLGSNANQDEQVDQRQSERRHFDIPPEDCMQLRSNEDQDEQVDSVAASESTETEEDNLEQNQAQRRHFHDKTSSNIFFSGLPPENSTLRDRSNLFDFRKRKG